MSAGPSRVLALLRLLDIQHESAADSDDAVSRYRPYTLILNGLRDGEVEDHTARRPGAQAAEADVEQDAGVEIHGLGVVLQRYRTVEQFPVVLAPAIVERPREVITIREFAGAEPGYRELALREDALRRAACEHVAGLDIRVV